MRFWEAAVASRRIRLTCYGVAVISVMRVKEKTHQRKIQLEKVNQTTALNIPAAFGLLPTQNERKEPAGVGGAIGNKAVNACGTRGLPGMDAGGFLCTEVMWNFRDGGLLSLKIFREIVSTSAWLFAAFLH